MWRVPQLRPRSATSPCRRHCSSSACSCRSCCLPHFSPLAWPACRQRFGSFPSPAPMTLVPGSGLLKRIETPEWYSSLRPEIRGIAEHVQQLLARLAVETRVVGQLLEHDHEARLRAGLVDQVGHAVVQRVEVFPEMGREQEGLCDPFEHLLFRLCGRQVGIQEML